MDVLEMKHTQARNRQVFDPFAERKRVRQTIIISISVLLVLNAVCLVGFVE
jgi:hypothetical protein